MYPIYYIRKEMKKNLFEALQFIMYIQLPPGISVLKLAAWGIFGLPLTHRVKTLQEIKSGTSHITHPVPYITHYILNVIA